MLQRVRVRCAWIAGILLAALVASGVVWWHWHKGDYFPKNFGVVEPGKIFRSGQISPTLVKKTLVDHHIKRVIDLEGAGDGTPAKKSEAEVCFQLGIVRSNFPLRGDGTGDIVQYANAISEIVVAADHGDPVLVHCAAGAQRTGGVIATYEILVQHKALPEVRREMLQYGWKPSDVKLLSFVNSNMRKLAELLVDRKVIEKIPDPLPQIPLN